MAEAQPPPQPDVLEDTWAQKILDWAYVQWDEVGLIHISASPDTEDYPSNKWKQAFGEEHEIGKVPRAP
eukprot:2363569-Karenia_brevis.AAC.1